MEKKIKLSDVKPNPNNPRKITAKSMKKLKKSISEFTAMMYLRPIVIDETNTILGGNQRFFALKALKYKEVPESWIKRAENLTDEEKKRFIIADNLAFGDWDLDALAFDWDIEHLDEWGFDTSVFEIEKVETGGITDNDMTETFNTKIMNIRHKMAKNIAEKDSIELSEAYLIAENLMLETLQNHEYYAS